jgi:hypothetical protein
MATTCNLPFEAKKYACGPIAQPMPGAVKSPFVNMIFFKGQRQVTVGNKSSNSASIAGLEDIANVGTAFVKSFTYSFSNGAGVEATIVDTSGSDFANFMTIMPSKECDPQKGSYSIVGVEFGWIFQDCNGVYQKYGSIEASYDDSIIDVTTSDKSAVQAGNYLWFMLTTITVTESRGIWEYKLKLESMMQSSAPYTKDSKAIGADDQKQELKTAIETALKESCKNYFTSNQQEKLVDDAKVKFVRVTKSNGGGGGSGGSQRILEDFNFKNSDGGKNGPKSVWAPEQQDPLSASRKWLNSFETDRNLGTVMVSDVREKRPVLLVMENPQDPCIISTECAGNEDKPKKVYIVNGGNCSPVLDFKPSVQLVFIEPTTNVGPNPTSMNTTNGQPNTATGNNATSSKNSNKCYKGELNRKGVETSMSIPGSNLNFRTPAQANAKEFKSIWANSAASKMYEVSAPVESDLVVEGDPRYLDIISCIGLNIGIIYLNPYAIRNNVGDCDWVAYPNVNEFFSRTNYMIQSVAHKIDESGYQTTLKLSSPIANQRR